MNCLEKLSLSYSSIIIMKEILKDIFGVVLKTMAIMQNLKELITVMRKRRRHAKKWDVVFIF